MALLAAVDASAGQNISSIPSTPPPLMDQGGPSALPVNVGPGGPSPSGGIQVVNYPGPSVSGSIQQVVVVGGQGNQSGSQGNQTGLQLAQNVPGLIQALGSYVGKTPGTAVVYHDTPGHQITYFNTGSGLQVKPGLP